MPYALLAFLVLPGTALVAYGSYRLWRLHVISDWPRVSATILSAELENVLSGRDEVPQFRPKLRYEYSVRGKTFGSTTTGISDSAFDFHSENEAKDFMAKVSPGSQVDVVMNPTMPREVFLAPGASGMRRSHYMAAVVSGLLLLLASAGVGWLMHA